MQFSKWLVLHFWHQEAYMILGCDASVVYALWKVPLFLNYDPPPLIHSPFRNVALNPDPLLLVDPGATDPDGPWYRGRFNT